MHQRQQSRATSNLLELWLQQHSTKLEGKKDNTTSRYLQWKRADRANNNNKYNERERECGECRGAPNRIWQGQTIYTKMCDLYLFRFYAHFLIHVTTNFRIDTSDWIHCLSLSLPFLWMLFSFRWCCSLFVLLSHSLFATHMPKKSAGSFDWANLFLQTTAIRFCCSHIVSHHTYAVG